MIAFIEGTEPSKKGVRAVVPVMFEPEYSQPV